MITSEEAITIAKKYAEEHRQGWERDYHEVTQVNIRGEPVWMISTSDIEYHEDFSWFMEHFPNPVYYYVGMICGVCIAVGNRRNEIHFVKKEGF